MDSTPSRTDRAPRGERLDSWKEIAAYLNRDIRTAQRWEKLEGLPVHRHLHDERSTAYAFAEEIDAWLQNRRQRLDAATDVEVLAPAAIPHSSNRLWIALPVSLAVAAGLIATVIAFGWLSRSDAARSPLSSLSMTFPLSERFREWGPDTALSPDGLTVVYTNLSGRLNIRRIDELTARVVPDTAGSWGPFFSPDGRWIGFNRAGHLMKVSIDGGAPVSVGVDTAFIGGADWGTDDHIVYTSITPHGSHGLYRVPASGGTPQLIATPDGNADEAYWLTPQSVANGTVILCTLARTVSGSRFQIVAVPVSGGGRLTLIDDAKHAAYLGDGVLVYLRNKSLFAARLDIERLEIRGPHVPAWDDVWERLRLRSWSFAAGTLVYWPGPQVGRRLVWVNRAGQHDPLPLPPARYNAPRISPDGLSIAYSVGDDFDSDVWKYHIVTRETVRLTSDGRGTVPLWTPDGSRVIVSWLRTTGRGLAQVAVGGTAALEPLNVPATFVPGASLIPVGWSDGGRTLVVRQYGAPAELPVAWSLAVDGSRDPRPVLPHRTTNPHMSPDGRWIAYARPESPQGPDHVYVARLTAGQPEWKVSTESGSYPVWARSGRELFYRSTNGKIFAVPVTLGETFAAGPPQLLFEAPFYEGDPGSPNYDVAADSERFLIVLPASSEGPDRLNVIQGWKAEILRRLDENR